MERINNHKVRNNPGSYFLGANMNLLCGNGIVGDVFLTERHSFYLSPTIPHKTIELTNLKAKNGLEVYHRLEWEREYYTQQSYQL